MFKLISLTLIVLCSLLLIDLMLSKQRAPSSFLSACGILEDPSDSLTQSEDCEVILAGAWDGWLVITVRLGSTFFSSPFTTTILSLLSGT
uniref:Secreted protein n=1 Tax=Panstrongylus lignarius TaxID=156445 RepID=A0A224Y3W6_9HEMI